MEVLRVHAASPDPAAIARAAELLRQGRLVAFPTETVYGLGANALDARAVAGIFEAKGRPAFNPLIVHVADATAARTLVSAWPASADALAERFWPGPLTLVLPRPTASRRSSRAGSTTWRCGSPRIRWRSPSCARAGFRSLRQAPIARPRFHRRRPSM